MFFLVVQRTAYTYIPALLGKVSQSTSDNILLLDIQGDSILVTMHGVYFACVEMYKLLYSANPF